MAGARSTPCSSSFHSVWKPSWELSRMKISTEKQACGEGWGGQVSRGRVGEQEEGRETPMVALEEHTISANAGQAVPKWAARAAAPTSGSCTGRRNYASDTAPGAESRVAQTRYVWICAGQRRGHRHVPVEWDHAAAAAPAALNRLLSVCPHHEDADILVLGEQERVGSLRNRLLQVSGLLLDLRSKRGGRRRGGGRGFVTRRGAAQPEPIRPGLGGRAKPWGLQARAWPARAASSNGSRRHARGGCQTACTC